LPIGRGEVLQDGSDLAIIAVGSTVHPALAAAVKKILTIEENVLDGGFGSAVLELLAENSVTDLTVRRLGIRDEFVQHATQAELRLLHGLDDEGILRAAKEMLGD
jgi:1-deoxy-D-xylulose-5-phosphate synthase